MKVLIVTPYFYPHIGGVEIYTLNMARNLQTLGWEVVIVTTSQTGPAGISTVHGMKVYHLKTLLNVSNTPFGLVWRRALRRIYKAEKPDVINAHTPVPYLADIAERVRGSIPFVLTYHNDVEKDSLIYKLIARLMRYTLIQPTLKRANAIIATSEYYVKQSQLLKPYGNKISIVPPGVDVTRFNQNVSCDSLLSRYKSKQVILFVGSLNKSQQHKGVDILIKAFARIHDHYADTMLVIVGAGDATEEYKALSDNQNVASAVEFTGRVSDNKLAKYYKLATVLALPSTNNNEGFGMVFIEAGAVGTPVIGSRVGGIPYAVLDKQTGLLVQPKSVKSLQNALETILTDHKLADRLGNAAAERVLREFDWKVLARKTDSVLKNSVKPTIVQVAGYYPPHLGGMEKVAQTISERLASRGFQTRVLTSRTKTGQLSPSDHANLQITSMRAYEIAHTPIAPAFLWTIFRIPRRSIIHLHLAQAYYPELVLLAAKVRHIPYVVHFHLDLQPSGSLEPLFTAYKSVIIKNVIQKANAVIVFSNEQQEFIHEKYAVDYAKIYVIPNGVSEAYFKQPSEQHEKSSHHLLYVGRLQVQKRVVILIDMMKHLTTKATLTVIGDGEDRHELEELVQAYKLKSVHFKGQLAPDQLVPYYHASDAFVIASENEGMPLAVLEAMAASLPIVGADVPGIRELVGPVGIVVDKPSGISFAQAVDSLLTNSKKQAQLASKSYMAARSYTWSHTIDALEDLYKKVMP